MRHRKQLTLHNVEEQSSHFECTWEWYVCAFVVVDKAMFAWFTEQHANNVPLPGKGLQHKAVDFPSILGHENFHANAGWG